MAELTIQLDIEPGRWWIAAAVGALLVFELVRYVLTGARPRARTARVVTSLVLAAPAAMLLRWSLTADGVARSTTLVVLLSGLTFVWLVRVYRPAKDRLGRARRVGLMLLRAIALLVVLVLVAGPTLCRTRTVYDKAMLAILIDDSRSMTVRDVIIEQRQEHIARAEAVNRVLEQADTQLRRLANEFDLRAFTFADRAVPLGIAEAGGWGRLSPWRVSGEGDFTAIGDALHGTYELAVRQGKPMAGAVLISDGGNNLSSAADPAEAARTLSGSNAAIWSVCVGSEVPAGQTRTISARRLQLPRRAAVMNRVPIVAEFLAIGLAGVPVKYELLGQTELAATKEASPEADKSLERLEFSYTPQVAGPHKITVRASAAVDGRQVASVSISDFLQVGADKIRVLYVDRRRYEYAAIVRSLAAADALSLTKATINPGGSAGLASPLPRRLDEWQRYDVVILGDLARSQIAKSQIEAIRDLVVEHGRGLAMVGGYRGLGSGEFGGTALDQIMPAALGGAGQIDRPVQLRLTHQGHGHSICRLGNEDPQRADIWQRLPLMPGASRLGAVKPAAEVLVESDQGEPMLVAQQVGAGRTAAIAFDSTWQWPLKMDAGDGGRIHGRFWRQLVIWLANRRPTLWITTDRPRYQLPLIKSRSQKVRVQLGLNDFSSGTEGSDAKIEATLRNPDGRSEKLLLTAQADHFEAALEPAQDGTYELQAAALRQGEPIAAQSARFIVESPDLELQEPLANLQLLRQLARTTQAAGGKWVPIERLSELLAELRGADARQPRVQESRIFITRAARWPLFAAFLAAVALEWVIRKKSRLV